MLGEARIIDANTNRAREALRVLEDVARFHLADETLNREAKELRHSLAAAIGQSSVDLLRRLASRDTPGDVGTGVTAEGEYSRGGLRGVAAAAGARLSEALRTIEECAKSAGDPALARACESLRYRAYMLEKRVLVGVSAGRAPQWRLCVLVSESLCRHHPWLEVARRAVAGGADCIQLREKSLDGRELLARASALVRLGRDLNVSVIVNDRPDIALLAGAAGVHLGQHDLPIDQVRRLAGEGLLIGISTESTDQAVEAASHGADYCGIGPMFPTATKEKPRLAGPDAVRAYLGAPRLGGIPHLAIGGITPANVGEVVRAGAKGIAVSSCVCAAPDPEAACRQLLVAMESAAV